MTVSPVQKAAGFLLLLDPETRGKVLEALAPEHRSRVETALASVRDLPPAELRQTITQVCEDPLLRFPIAQRELEAHLSETESTRKWFIFDRARISRILRYLDPSIVFYRRMDDNS